MTASVLSLLMRRRRLVLVLAVTFVLIGASVSVALRELKSRPSGTGSITQDWLNYELSVWKPLKNGSLIFGATDQRASYGIPSYNNQQVQMADLHMLLSSNATAIRIDIGYAPWLSNDTSKISEIESVVNGVNSSGRALIIADASSESYRSGGQLPWSQFKAQWLLRVKALATAFHPYAYIVVKEPGWYFPMISDSLTNPAVHNPYDWANLTSSLVSTVKSVSPGTKVGVSVAAYGLYNSSYYKGTVSFNVKYLEQVEKIQSLDFIGFDIYDTQGFNGTLKFLAQAGNGGKAVWIAEAWSGSGSYVYSSSRAALDQEWMQVLYEFALRINASAIIPFYTDIFSSYSWNTNSTDIVSNYAMRQPVFHEFSSLAVNYSLPA